MMMKDTVAMKDSYEPLPGESLKERQSVREKEIFLDRAINSIKKSGWGWARFVQEPENTKYKHVTNSEELRKDYERLLEQGNRDRFYGENNLNLEKELARVRQEEAERVTHELTERRYQQLRSELLDRAVVRQPFGQVRRELDLAPEDETLYKRARVEAGTDKMTDLADPLINDGFIDGFFAE